MAPEVSTAVPGSWKWISYEKSDVWSVGAMAYEIFGDANPFYKTESVAKPLDSRSYKDSDLQPISTDVSPVVRKIVNELLKRSANEVVASIIKTNSIQKVKDAQLIKLCWFLVYKRMSAQEAAMICHLHLWGPSHWLAKEDAPTDDEVNMNVISKT